MRPLSLRRGFVLAPLSFALLKETEGEVEGGVEDQRLAPQHRHAQPLLLDLDRRKGGNDKGVFAKLVDKKAAG